MTLLVDAVARALCKGLGSCYCENGDICAGRLRAARAAIATMREPTEAMLQNAAIGRPPSWSLEFTQDLCRELWRGMIDTALKEGAP